MPAKKNIDPNKSVAALYPHLILEWHPTKNSELKWTLWEVTHGSRKEAWWLCPECGNEWEREIRSRAGDRTGCPECAKKIRGQKNSTPKPEQSFGNLYPQYVAEWHPEKNDWSPHEFRPEATYRAVWICPKCNHEWSANIKTRVMGQGRCKKCESFGTKHPDLLQEWNTELNSKSAFEVSHASHYNAAWICSTCGKGWRASVHNRVIGATGCPVCSKINQVIGQRKPKPGNSLAETFPIVALEWHPTLNVDEMGKILTPWDISSKSGFNAHWICARGHQWQTTVKVRANGSGCPHCRPVSSRPEIRIYCEIHGILEDVKWLHRIDNVSIDVFIPKYNIAIEYDGNYWHSDKENIDRKKDRKLAKKGISLFRVRESGLKALSGRDIVLEPMENGISMVKKLFVKILENTPKFEIRDADKFISYLERKDFLAYEHYVSKIDSLPGPTYEESLAFLFPDLLNEWDFEANGILKPENVRPGTELAVWWKCKNGHKWKFPVKNRAKGGGSCPYCRSLAFNNPVLAAEWHPTLNVQDDGTLLTAWDVHLKSSRSVWWLCQKCRHEWKSQISNRSNGQGCPKCRRLDQSMRQKRPSLGKSFADKFPDLISEWHPSLNVDENGNAVTPWDVNPGAEEPRWWICKTCSNMWHVAPKKRASGRGCLKCARKKMKIAQRLPARGQSLSECNPEIAKEWHPTANKDEFGTIIKPTQVSRGSGYRATWVCSKCHKVWEARVIDRTVNNSGCPECYQRLRKKRKVSG